MKIMNGFTQVRKINLSKNVVKVLKCVSKTKIANQIMLLISLFEDNQYCKEL